MRIRHHPATRFDVLEIMEYYEEQAGSELAADFFAEMLRYIDRIGRVPESFPKFN